AVAAKTLPSVVNINIYEAANSRGYSYNYSPNSGSDSANTGTLQEVGLGSGVILTADGYILTNYHVVEGADQLMVRISDDQQLQATVVGTDPSSDLAVVKVDATGLTPIEVADSDSVRVGQWVMALGSPFGLDKSVSTGVVSALFRSTTMESMSGTTIYANLIQTDAAINPGNSGGALVNSEGKLIGINTLISSSTDSSAGVGFAIPSNFAMNVANQIMAGKTVEHAFLGVSLSDVSSSSSSQLSTSSDTGALVQSVVSGSPAETAGIQTGDIITKIDGTSIDSATSAIIAVRGHLVGDAITIEVQRGDQTITLNATLGSDATTSQQ
ncbi:MAG: trypsin-like peptidase domain-containing protein, partial [Coriobacteriia bacterium]|nr:trypsin-like peptidase domain-containing protein [Coriobacteriia bacterium]